LSEDKIEHPETMVKVGDELEVRILRVDTADRKIGLSCRSDEEIREAAAAEAAQGGGGDGGGSAPARKVEDLKGGTGDSSKPLFSLGGSADDSSDADDSDAGDGDAKAEDATEEENSDEEKPSEEG